MRVAILSNHPIYPFIKTENGHWPNEHPYPWVRTLAEALVRTGESVFVVALRRDVHKPLIFKENGVEYHFVPYPHKIVRKLIPLSAPAKAIRKYLEKLNPTIVHVQGAGIYSHAALNSHWPVVVTVHGIVSDYPIHLSKDHKREIMLEREVIEKARHIISISPYVTNWLQEFGYANKVYPIENPVNPVFYLSRPKSNHSTHQNVNRVLFVGGLAPRKRVEDAISSADQVPEMKLDIVSHAFSSTDYRDKIMKMIQELKMNDHVNFCGYKEPETLSEIMHQSLCLILPTEAETAPLVIAEAMATGLPVIATRVGGIPYLIDDGHTGFLVDVGDTKSMADKIRILSRDQELWRRMSKASVVQAKQRFYPDLVASSTLLAYKDILSCTHSGK